MNVLAQAVRFLSSFGLACVLLANLFLLTLFGTFFQIEGGLYEAQKRYFESWFVTGTSPVPHVLPGGMLTMGLLALNLFLGGFVRIQKSWRTAGVIVVHAGIALMLAAALVKQTMSEDGHLTLVEGESSDEFASYYLWEVAVWDAAREAQVEEHLIPDADLSDLVGGRVRTFSSASLPFDIELSRFLENCAPLPKGPNWVAASPVVEGYALLEDERNVEKERNIAGLTARFRERGGGASAETILWGAERLPATFACGGKTWAISLRHKRYSMPFAIRLEDFRKVDHPGMRLAKSFESDVTKFEDGAEQKVRIQMNEPLRHEGLVLFQSGFDDQMPGREVSIFSVVRNPSDYWPLWSCIVIAVGLLMAFVPKLERFVRTQNKSRARMEVAS